MSGNYFNEEPDYFGYYSTEVKALLSQDESNWPFSNSTSRLPRDMYDVVKERKGKGEVSNSTKKQDGKRGSPVPLFSNGIGARISEFKNERLTSLLRQSVSSLTQEVDEMVGPVDAFRRIRKRLTYKESFALAVSVDQTQHANKRQKLLSASGVEGKRMQINEPAKEPLNDTVKKCIVCHKIQTPQWRPAPDGTMSLCNACWLRAKKIALKWSPPDIDRGKEKAEHHDNLRMILENGSTNVEELMTRNSSELLGKLQYMEQKLEELLYSVMSSCRSMTLEEKYQLKDLIESLPPENHNGVVEIVEHNKPPDRCSSDTVIRELRNEDDATLWRLYFYCTSVTRES